MPGIATRKSNFADLESFEDFEPKAPPAAVQETYATAVQSTPSIAPEPMAAGDTAELLPDSNPYLMANARKEKADLQRLARQSGYTINNLVEKPIPARLEPESNTFLKTVRIEVSDWNRFQRWCHANSYSHKKGFKILTQKLPVK
jgi:hypothetical protein